jgi:nicotinamidase/pyrazinamidase
MRCRVLFWDVDTQHDFIDEDGKLPAPGAPAIIPNLQKLTRAAVEHGVPIVATTDAHPTGDPEFGRFGEHCVPGTRGQRKIAETSPPGAETVAPDTLDDQVRRLLSGEAPQLVVEKQVLDAFDQPLADRVVSRIRPGRIIAYGVATEYCVRAEVLSLLRRGYDVTVVTDAIRAITDEAGEAALKEMRKAGARTADTAAVLGSLSRKAGR